MERRELLKGIALAAAVSGNQAGEAQGLIPAAGSSSNGDGIDITPIPKDYYIPDRFKGKTLIVTGCARGMGAAAAVRAAREGANVVGVDWITELGAKVIAGIVDAGGKAVFVPGDVGQTATCEKMVQVAVESFGGLDFALNNAGVMDGVYSGDPVDYAKQKPLIFARLHEATDEYWDRVLQTNSTGVFRSLRAELRQLVAQRRGGAIVNVGSIAGMTGLSGNPAYVASKHAVNGLTRNAAIDYAPYGIRVNSVNMAATDTPMVERAGILVRESMKSSGQSNGPSMARAKTQSVLAYADSHHRPATVGEQVSTMLYLLSSEASNLTGGVFPTDGGWTDY